MIIHHSGREYLFENNILSYSGFTLGAFQTKEDAIFYLESGILSESFYKKFNTDLIALALYESGETRVTETLIENIKILLEKKLFYPSDVILELRLKYDNRLIEGKVEYRLLDGSKVLLSVETNKLINKFIDVNKNQNIVNYMNTSSKNFYSVIEPILEKSYGN